jgi:fructokinase
MQRITSIGEILFDIYPERKSLGGAPFNFIYHIVNLTGSGNFVSRIGKDKPGNEILKFLKKEKIAAEYIQIDERHTTGESIARLNEFKVPSWEIKANAAYDFIETTNEIKALVKNKTDCLYFGTLAQRNTTTRQTIHQFFNRDLKYFCDLNIRQNFFTKELIKECVTECNVLKLNMDELHLVNELLFKNDFDKNETPKRLLYDFNIELICVTNGEEGSSVFNSEGCNHVKIKTNSVVDTVGAGDAYSAILCLGFLRNWNIEKINTLAAEFAAEVVKINGAIPTSRSFYEKYKPIINE